MLRDHACRLGWRASALVGFCGLFAVATAGCVVEAHPRTVVVEDQPRERVVYEDRGTTTVYEEEPGEVEVTVEPPAPRVEIVHEVRPGYAWIHGYWVRRGGGWVWVGGHWHGVPRGHSVYVSGHWDRRGNVHVWVGGYWR